MSETLPPADSRTNFSRTAEIFAVDKIHTLWSSPHMAAVDKIHTLWASPHMAVVDKIHTLWASPHMAAVDKVHTRQASPHIIAVDKIHTFRSSLHIVAVDKIHTFRSSPHMAAVDKIHTFRASPHMAVVDKVHTLWASPHMAVVDKVHTFRASPHMVAVDKVHTLRGQNTHPSGTKYTPFGDKIHTLRGQNTHPKVLECLYSGASGRSVIIYNQVLNQDLIYLSIMARKMDGRIDTEKGRHRFLMSSHIWMTRITSGLLSFIDGPVYHVLLHVVVADDLGDLLYLVFVQVYDGLE